MRKTHFTAQEESDIALIMEETGISRKSAIRKLQRRAKLAAKKVKAPKAAKPKSETPKTEAGSARAAGIALYKMAGRPTRKDFLHVYGDMGAKWTWEARAKAVNLPSAEAAAQQPEVIPSIITPGLMDFVSVEADREDLWLKAMQGIPLSPEEIDRL